ncbi:glucose-6-phosphate dehydrogenase assembly protein OpcA, partial [Geodermatophilus sp. SYSU D00742]
MAGAVRAEPGRAEQPGRHPRGSDALGLSGASPRGGAGGAGPPRGGGGRGPAPRPPAPAAAEQHPCRLLIVVRRQIDAPAPRLDAEVLIGGRLGPGEAV